MGVLFCPFQGYYMEEHKSTATPSWLTALRTQGYVVIPATLAQDQVVRARELTWDWLESLGSGLSRSDMTTWRNENWPGELTSGIVASSGAGQSEAAWFVRGVEGVKKAFVKVWGTEDLITSMDAVILWRPWWKSDREEWKPQSFGLHLDQNILDRPGFLCVQGMVPLYPVTQAIGGLKIVPSSHKQETQDKVRAEYPQMKGARDFWRVKQSDLMKEPELIIAQPGDLILWDSRMVHIGDVGMGEEASEELDTPQLARCAYTVCMVPRNKATEEVLENRKKAFDAGETLCHRPDQYTPHVGGISVQTRNVKSSYKQIKLSEQQRALL